MFLCRNCSSATRGLGACCVALLPPGLYRPRIDMLLPVSRVKGGRVPRVRISLSANKYSSFLTFRSHACRIGGNVDIRIIEDVTNMQYCHLSSLLKLGSTLGR
jgi:hypothetical protein